MTMHPSSSVVHVYTSNPLFEKRRILQMSGNCKRLLLAGIKPTRRLSSTNILDVSISRGDILLNNCTNIIGGKHFPQKTLRRGVTKSAAAARVNIVHYQPVITRQRRRDTKAENPPPLPSPTSSQPYVCTPNSAITCAPGV